MKNAEYSKLRIKASSTDSIGTKLFYEYITELARDSGISGATVYRGIMGYGASSKISSSSFWELTEKLPVVIELIDKTEMLLAFYEGVKQDLYEMPKGCLVTLEPVQMLLQKKGL
jgi:PII-like signaling protein